MGKNGQMTEVTESNLGSQNFFGTKESRRWLYLNINSLFLFQNQLNALVKSFLSKIVKSIQNNYFFNKLQLSKKIWVSDLVAHFSLLNHEAHRSKFRAHSIPIPINSLTQKLLSLGWLKEKLKDICSIRLVVQILMVFFVWASASS